MEDDELVQSEAFIVVLGWVMAVETAVGEAEVVPVLVALIELG